MNDKWPITYLLARLLATQPNINFLTSLGILPVDLYFCSSLENCSRSYSSWMRSRTQAQTCFLPLFSVHSCIKLCTTCVGYALVVASARTNVGKKIVAVERIVYVSCFPVSIFRLSSKNFHEADKPNIIYPHIFWVRKITEIKIFLIGDARSLSINI